MSQSLKTKHVFIVPYWIVNLLERHSLPLTTVNDLVKLRSIASAEDLVLTLLLNQDPTMVFGVNSPTSGPNAHWVSSPAAYEIYRQLEELAPLHQQGLAERLFSETQLDARYPKEFDIRDMDDETFLIVIYPGHFGGNDGVPHQTKLLHAYLKQCYGYSNFDSVARDPLFRQYVARL